MLISKFDLVLIIVAFQFTFASQINDEECDEQFFALIEAVTTQQFWALKRWYPSPYGKLEVTNLIYA